MTIAVVAGTIAGLIAYDVWTGVRRGSDTTISVVSYRFAKQYPIFAFLLGLIFGHILWTQ